MKITNTIEGVVENRNEHILRNKRLIWSVVQRFINRGYDPDDLFQIGAIGYMKAFDRFDDKFGCKWSTYAVPMIIGEIQRFIRDDGTIKTPRRLKELANKFRYNDCYGLKREEIAEKLELDLSEVDELLYFMKVRTPSSIEQTVYENDGDPITLADQVGDFDDYTGSFVNEFLQTLDERDAQVVKLVMAGMKQQEIADQIGVSQVQVSRIIKNKVKPLLEEFLGETGKLDKVVKERAPRKSKPVLSLPKKEDKPKQNKQERVVVMYKVNKKKPLNGLTVDIYNAMRAEGKTNTQIKLHFKLSNNTFFSWKKENGLTDKVKSARIIKGLKETQAEAKQNNVQGDDVEMLATAVNPVTQGSFVSQLDKQMVELETTIENYKAQVASRDQEIKRLHKEADQKHVAFEEAVATLNKTWENKVLEEQATVKNAQSTLQMVLDQKDDLIDVNTKLGAKLEQMDFDFNEIVAERDRYESEAHELKRLYEKELERANRYEAECMARQVEEEQKDLTNSYIEQIKELTAKCHDLEEQNASLVNMRGDLEENTRQLQNAAFSENKALIEKVKQLEATLKLYL